MTEVHSKNTVILLDDNDLSPYLNDSDWTRSPESHKLTAYGDNNNRYKGGLGDGSTDLSGKYDNTAVTGPRAVIEPLIGTNVELVYRPEGTGTGLPERTVEVLVGEYKETHPVADYVMWTLKLTHSGDVTTTTQT
ncbi:hypothetical protein ABZX66_28145 [Micromonospora aurantiaca]|uniref:hypothetical protein n=1 Tax=Micromonospora aurantiaca (nom. illeg.) TaxID=47850 RepID=UPI0033AC0720